MTKSEKIAQINAKLTADIAAEKARKEQTVADYYTKVAELQREACEAKDAATDDEPQDEEPQEQPTVWLDGSQHSAVIVARRVLRKLPKLNFTKESFNIEISPSHFGGCGLSFRYVNTIDKVGGVAGCDLIAAKDTPDVQAMKVYQWLKDVDVQMVTAKEIMRREAGNE